MRILIFLLIFISSISAFAQIDKYPHSYRLTLADFPSYCYFQIDPSTKALPDAATQLIEIKILENDTSPVPFANVSILFSNGETLKLVTDENGIVKRRIAFDNFHLIIQYPNFTYLDEFVPMSSDTRITKVTALLGKSFNLVIPILKSNRPLTEMEVIEIIKDLSNGKKKLRLVEDKTCVLSYEI